MKNYTKDLMEKRAEKVVTDTYKMAKDQRTTQMGHNGWQPIPVRASDPPVTGAGQAGIYFNSATGKWRKSANGSAWADTTI